MRRSYLDYSMSVIVGRALPDIRDGLKPVHRRILYGMSEHGSALQPSDAEVRQDRRRSAGQVPSARRRVRSTTRWFAWRRRFRCATRWWMARATSARWTAIRRRRCGTPRRGFRASRRRCWKTSTRKRSISRPNYDDSEHEPEVLPTRVPNLLVNGSSGIAVGMATNIPPHNLTEIVERGHPAGAPSRHAAARSDGDRAGAGLPHRRIHPGPLGHFRLLHQGPRDASRSAPRRRRKRSGKDREAIIVTEIPYQVNKARLIEHAAALVNEKKIEGISDIRDESDRDGMRIVFELKRGEQAEIILNNLYKHTQMQVNFGVIMLSIVNGQPRELGLIDVHQALHRPSRRRGAPPHRLPVAQGARARAHLARLPEGARPIWTR